MGRKENRIDMEQTVPVGRERWRYLLISAAGLLFVGIIYAWSILKVPLADEFGWAPSMLAFNYTLTMSFFCLGSVISGYLSRRAPFQVLLLIAGALIFGGLWLVSGMKSGEIAALYLSYGVVFGLGIGLSYNTLLSVGNSWFPDKKGTSSGLLMMCFGFSTMVLGKTASRLFDLPSFGWRKTFFLLGLSVFVVLALCALLLKKPGGKVSFPKQHCKKEEQGELFEQRDYSTAETVRRPAFWLFYVYGTLAASVGSAVISFACELSMSLGADASLAATLVGVLSVCNGMGRIFCGLCFDRIGRRNTMLAVSAVTLVSPAVMLAALHMKSLPVGILSLCLTGISYGCCPTISSAFISSFYGMRDFSMNYSLSNTKMLLSSFAATFASTLYVSTGSYTAPFIMLLAFAALSLVFNFFIRRP